MPTAGLPGSKRSPNTAGQFPSGRPSINPRRSMTGNASSGWNKSSPTSRSSRTLERETSLFFLPGDYPSRQRNRAGRTSPDVMLPLYAPVSGAAGPISAPVGESGAPFLDCRALEGERHLLSSLCRASCCFQRFFSAGSDGRAISSRCRLESEYIPMTEELWLVHVTEPVTETIS